MKFNMNYFKNKINQENDFEVVVDKFVLNNIINGDSNRAKTVGLNSPEDFINKKIRKEWKKAKSM